MTPKDFVETFLNWLLLKKGIVLYVVWSSKDFPSKTMLRQNEIKKLLDQWWKEEVVDKKRDALNLWRGI